VTGKTDVRTPPATAIILVVEDEPIIRLAAVDLVEEAGYIAVEASNAAEAVRILETRPDIRVVFTDIDMPGSMDGMKLALCVRDRWPPIKLIVVSGHHTPGAADMPEGAVFFSKPYSESALTAALKQLVGEVSG